VLKRWLLAMVLFGLTASLVQADYLLVIINVGYNQDKMTTPGTGMMGVSGMPAVGVPPGTMMGNRGMAGAVGMMGATGVPMGQMGGVMGNTGGPISQPSGPKPILIPLCIELEGPPIQAARLQQYMSAAIPVQHKWGKAYLLQKTGPIVQSGFYVQDNKTLPGIHKRFELEKARLSKDSKDKTNLAERTLEVAEWALSHGMHAEFEKIMDALALEEKEHPKILAYLKIKAELVKRIDKGPSSASFTTLAKKSLEKEDKSPHYTILHDLPKGADVGDVAARAALLEHNLKGFYYWWALRGVTLPMPTERLGALMTTTEDAFKYYHKGLSGGQIVYDGFHESRDNLVVMSLEPRGSTYFMLKDVSSVFWTQANMGRATMLKGPRTAPQKEEQVQAGLCALALKAMEERMAEATVSHHGTRQLFYAAGLLPPNVIVPEWVLQGMGSIFETPPEHPWETLGAAHPLYLPLVRKLKKEEKLEATDVDTLRQIVTDGYFHQAHAKPQDRDLQLKAKATAWMLCYHLARNEPVKLQAYFKELGRLPPDIDLDEEVLMNCFARAFDAWDSNKKMVDKLRLDKMVLGWTNSRTAIPLEAEDLVQTIRKLPAEGERILATPPPQPMKPPGQ
jgi:Protein of unknown function (DUF1570)